MKEQTSEELKKESLKKLSQSEFESKVLELAEKGVTSEKIGETLRRQGIHSKEYDKKISLILKEKKAYTQPDIKNVTDKLEVLKKHCETNKHDKRAMREKDRIFSQLRTLERYHKVQ